MVITVCDQTGFYPELPVAWSQRRESNPRPADYKSAALPTELLWHDSIYNMNYHIYKELKLTELSACFFGKAKVSEFVKWKNFEVFFIRNLPDL